MSINTTLKILTLCAICTVMVMSGCIENDVPIEIVIEENVSTPTPSALSTPTPETTPTPTPEPKVFAVELGDKCGTDNLKITVESYHIHDCFQYMNYNKISFIDPSPGHQFIVIKATIENKGSHTIATGALDFSMVDNEGIICNYHSYPYCGTTIIENEMEFIRKLFPNQKMTGHILFEIPKDCNNTMAYYDFGYSADPDVASWNITIDRNDQTYTPYIPPMR